MNTNKLRLPTIVILTLVYAIFALWAQHSKGIGMDISPLQMAATQPYVVWQVLIGVALGVLLGFQSGYAFARLWNMHSQGRADALLWASAFARLVPWSLAAFLSIQGYDPVMILAEWAGRTMKQMLPLTMALDHSFLFSFAAGYFWACNPKLSRRRED